ncbi:hypothetical protein BIU96_14140 [Curtobacterium sp. MCBA15_008]|nr:hypothetical protein BIU96_14140 [Curtobacterium sp. MCBA15_008]
MRVTLQVEWSGAAHNDVSRLNCNDPITIPIGIGVGDTPCSGYVVAGIPADLDSRRGTPVDSLERPFRDTDDQDASTLSVRTTQRSR